MGRGIVYDSLTPRPDQTMRLRAGSFPVIGGLDPDGAERGRVGVHRGWSDRPSAGSAVCFRAGAEQCRPAGLAFEDVADAERINLEIVGIGSEALGHAPVAVKAQVATRPPGEGVPRLG